MKIVEDLDKLRKLSDKSVAALSKTTGVSAPALGKFFQGKSELGSTKLFRVLDELGISLDERVKLELREKTGLIDQDTNHLTNDFLVLFEKLNDINKRIVLTSLLKPLLNSKEKLVLDSLKRIKSRISAL